VRNILTSSAIAAALILSGCGGGSEPKKEESKTAPPAATAPPVDEANAATVTGKVSFTGDKPKVPTIDMSANPACSRAHSTPAKSEEVVLNDNGTLKNVLVYVKGVPDRQYPTPSNAVELDQKGCMYGPHVIAVMAGQNIQIKNNDPTNHNIHPLPKINQEWNESQAPGSDPKMRTFAREEMDPPIAVKCNVHPWMRSYIAVSNNPYIAVTGDDGSFTIKGLPPGSYTMTAWHEKYGKKEMPVTVAAKDSKAVDFSYDGK
jgi:plastocyanin